MRTHKHSVTAHKSLQRLVLALFLLSTATLSLAKPKNKPDLKALLITGGCCHDYQTQSDILPAAVDIYSDLNVEWTVYHQRTKASDRLLELYKDPNWANGYDVVVHNECFAKVGKEQEEFVEGILKPHRDGIPAVLVHCSLHSYREGTNAEDWWKFCGLHSKRHDKKYPFTVQLTNLDHEAVEGMSNWTTPNGELYFVEKTYPTMTVLAEAKSKKDGNMHPIIWVNEYGPNKTRVFATSVGHHNETMLQPEYMEMFTRGLLWAAGKPVVENVNEGAKK